MPAMLRLLCALWLTAATTVAGAAQGGARLEPVTGLSFAANDPLTLRQPALPNHPFTVTGRSGAILGMQDGTVELWQLPTKLFSAMHLRAEVEGYSVPIELNPLAAELEVSPDHTTLTYAHAAVTVRQHMFVPAGEGNEGLGGQMLFEIQAARPVTLVVSLTPAMVQMWPAPQWGQPGWGWRAMGSGGAYTLSTDNPELFGMLAMPSATPGDLSPYQEHPHTLPLEFRVHFDPQRDAGHVFPLLCELARPGERNSAEGMAALETRLLATATALPQIYARTASYYAHFFDHRTVTHTTDAQLDRGLQWAELAIDKAQATIPAHDGQPAETGLVAGWFPSFDSARPGFGWFFGRDTLWSMYAIDGYGDSALTREAFDFLIRRQRADGKMPHEFSQTAASLTGEMTWSRLPYEYAAADATPLFLLATEDYVRTSGDLAFLNAHWDAVQRAYAFESTHDSDGDGVYDNSEGTGWVEDWPKPPHQELYLAALDRDATRAMVQLARWTQHDELARGAAARAAKVEAAVAAYRQPDGSFAFSRNTNGSYDATATVYPAVALWSSAAGLPEPAAQVRRWADHTFATDWGTRAVAATDPVFDPLSYHRGTVWPLFTGWNSVAQYRSGHPLAGYAALRQNLDLTWAQDPGAVTELLSGSFYEPLGRSSTHQLWSSAMVLAPALRELFGLEPDAPRHTLLVHPHLPPTWAEARLDHVHVGAEEFTVSYRRDGAQLLVNVTGKGPSVLCLNAAPELPILPDGATNNRPCQEAAATAHALRLALPPVELSLADQAEPLPGAETLEPHLLDEQLGARESSLTVEAPAGTTVALHLTRNGAAAHDLRIVNGRLAGDHLLVTMPAGKGWVQQHVAVRW